MTKAVWKGVVIAESSDIVQVEGNAYFPRTAVNENYLRKSPHTRPTYCHWKGIATYFDVVADGVENIAAAWWYPEPYDEASALQDHVAFWNDVEIVDGLEMQGLVEQRPSVIKDRTGWKALCWLLKFTEEATLSPDQVAQKTGISAPEVAAAWDVYDVQRYASHYNWQLIDNTARGASPWIKKLSNS